MTYKEACANACQWCAKNLSGDRKVTGVLKDSHTTSAVHKVYPPYVDSSFSEYLPCTAPALEAWAESESARADAAIERLKEKP